MSVHSFDFCAEVQPGLYIGSLAAVDAIAAMEFTHVLSVINVPVKLVLPLVHLQLHVLDDENVDILQHLHNTCDFIEAALEAGGKVLVHCQAGMSRSATVVLAYLMRARRRDYDQAFHILCAKWPVCPNRGFIMQLEAFHEMGYTVDVQHPVYRRVVRMLHAGRIWMKEVDMDEQSLAEPSDFLDMAKDRVYRCRKCRCLLASVHNVVVVEEGAGKVAFSYRKQRKSSGSTECGDGDGGESSVFVEPMRWMDGILEGAVQGKLYCPTAKCHCRLGSFNWSGLQSSSGRWVIPAFQLHLSRLDVEIPSDAMAFNIRVPAKLHQTAATS